MRPALDRDVRIRQARRGQLAQRAEQEGVARADRRRLAPPLQRVLQLLEDGVLQDRVDDEDQGRQHAREERAEAFVPEQGAQGVEGGGAPFPRGAGAGEAFFVRWGRRRGLAGRHARVDDPDGVCGDDGGGAGDGAGDHGLEGGELFGGAACALGGALEEGAGPFVPWRRPGLVEACEWVICCANGAREQRGAGKEGGEGKGEIGCLYSSNKQSL